MDEVLIYDERTHLGHCLNWTAAAVWRACGSERTIADITRQLQAHANPDIDEQMVGITLSKLKSAGLLDETIPAERESLSRSAKQLLEKTARSIDEIAYDTGFGSAPTLRHHFRRRLNTSPVAYRSHFRVNTVRKEARCSLRAS
jgi:hypothetical protein